MASTQRQVGEVLSELARDNYRGLIDPHTYRLQRAQILDQLIDDDDDEEASSTTRPQAPTRDRRAANPPLSDPANQRRRDVDRVREQVETAEVLQIVDAAKEQARQKAQQAADALAAKSGATAATLPGADTLPRAQESAPASGRKPAWPMLLGGAAVVLAIAAVVMMVGGEDTAQETPAPGQHVVSLQPGEKLIDDFVTADNWSEDSMLALTQSWQQLLPSQQRQALDSSVFRSFAYDVRRRLLESAALRELEGTQSERDTALTALAVAFDLPVPSAEDELSQPPAAPQTEVPGVVAADPQPEPEPEPERVTAATPAAQVAPVAAPSTAPAAAEPAAPPDAVVSSTEPTPAKIDAQSNPQETQTAQAVAPDTPVASAVAAPSQSGCHAGLLKTRQRSCADVLATGGEGPRMAIVRPGSFTMGSEWAPEEQPPHTVAIGKAFGIAAYEISHGEYARYCTAAGVPCPANPWGADDYPVVGVSWAQAAAFARWLSEQTGRNYRLPTEAEWEFAARAGVESRYPFGDELSPVQARYASEREAGEPWPRSYRDAPRNAFGVYNSIGNVREWVADAWHDSHAGAPADGSARDGNGAVRVVRGGSFADDSSALRLSSRTRLEAASSDRRTGFRVALDF